MKNIKTRLGIIAGVLIVALVLTGIILKGVNAPYFFIQMTDPQFGFIDPANGFAKETELLEKAVAEINRLEPAFVVITGDLVHKQGDSLQIAEFKRITGKINTKIPVYIIPGNHDIGQALEQKDIDWYVSTFGDSKFSFKYRQTYYIGINSSIIKANSPGLENEQFNWLETELSGIKNPEHIIIFSHHPFFISSPDEPDNYSNMVSEIRQKYIGLFEKYSVEAIFAGHTHSNGYAKSGDLEMIITSAVGRQLGKDASGFRIVKVDKDKIETDYYSLDEVPASITFDSK